jgi:Tol biopolymer transport system component
MDSMSPDRSVEDRISAWLQSEAPDQLPDRVLRATFQRTGAGRERRVLGWRRFGTLSMTPATAVAGFVAIALVVAGAVLLPRAISPYGGNPTPPPTPTLTANPSSTLEPVSLTGQIAFERTVDGNTDIYLMNLDRTGYLRLTDDPAPDRNPGWSPDGKRIVFTREDVGIGDLFVMNADGSEQRQLTAGPFSEDDGRFSPDGASIAYWRGHEASTQLRLVDPDGSNDRLVLELTYAYTGGVAWTADGQAILFNRDLSPEGGQIDIIRVEIASKALTAITADPGDDSNFALSPDGTTIAFQSDRSPGGIFLMDLDGANVRYLIGTWTKGRPLSWSPDGQYLVLAHVDGWLYLARADGGQLTKWAEGGKAVAWRPSS